MKKILFLFYIIFSFGVSGFTQSTTVYTCKGGAVSADVLSAGTTDQKNAWRQQFLNYGASTGLGASDILAEASGAYNCHAYAWHLREGNTNQVWINNSTYVPGQVCQPETHNIDKYWTDGCFIRVCNVSDADKTHYFCGDHSAVTSTVVAGKFESKWGRWPVIRHYPTNVPYEQPSSVNYYASTKMSGSTANLCSGTRTFSVKNITGATYLWTYSSTLAVVGPINTNQITVQKNGSATGAAWVSVQISTLCSGAPVVSRSDFSIAPPATTGSYKIGFSGTPIIAGAVNYVPPSPAIIYLTINNTQAINSYAYTIQKVYGSSFVNIFDNTANFSLGNYSAINPATGTLTLLTTVNTNCGSVVQSYTFSTQGQCGSCGSLFRVSPNPANTTIDISPTNNSSQLSSSAKNTSTPSIKEIRLIDKMGNIKLTKRYADDLTKTDRINIAGLPNDIYTLMIFNGTDWEAHKIVKQ